MNRILTAGIISRMWAAGRPSDDARFANVYRAAVKAGLDGAQAMALTGLAYDAAKLYTLALPAGSSIQLATRQRNARENPNSQDAADLVGAPWPKPVSSNKIESSKLEADDQ